MAALSLNYERLERQMASADLEVGGAEVHGVLCGLICAGSPDPRTSWFTELFSAETAGDLLVKTCRDSLSTMFQETQEAVAGSGLGLTPFLPDEEQPIKVRARAVSEWCQGFLYGAGLAGLSAQVKLSEDAQDALQSLSDITRMDLEEIEEGEESEASLSEVSEFIWVAAMLIHSELGSSKGGQA